MKKLIPALAILGSAVAFAVYKMKKDEKKQIMELDQDLLLDDDELDEDCPESEHKVKDFVKKSEKIVERRFARALKGVKAEEEKISEKVSDFTDDVEDKIDDMYGKVKRNADMFADIAQDKADSIRDAINEAIDDEDYLLDDEIDLDDDYDDEDEDEIDVEDKHSSKTSTFNHDYSHLTSALIDSIKEMSEEAMDSLANDGDVHEHERPVQHMVTFKSTANLDNFKNKVINKGFVITKGEGELDLVVLHISPIDNVKLLSNVLFLADQTYANGGEYKGWQSKVSY